MRPAIPALAKFGGLFGFWMLLSWRLDPLFVAMGLLAAALVTAMTRPLDPERLAFPDGLPLRKVPVVAVRAIAYGGWLLFEIVPASFQVAYFVLHPRMPLDQGTVRFPTTLRSPMARAVLSNSITLIPGTLTVDLEGDEIVVHYLVPGAARELFDATMQNKIARIFLEEEQAPVTPEWLHDRDQGRTGGESP